MISFFIAFMVKFSIVIPVFNVEKYIKKCLESIYCQGFDESLYEVIVVNDGTQDNSIIIVNDFVKIHSNLRIIEQENRGVSSARNVGIRYAKGDYITFLDADDWIENNSLKYAYEYLESCENLDVLVLKSNKEDGTERYAWCPMLESNVIYSGVDTYEKGFRRGSVCGGFYKKEFLNDNNISFPLGVKNGEDSIVISLILAFAKKICFVPIPFYIVYERQGSASRSFSENNLKSINQTLDSAFKIRNERLQYVITPQQSFILADMLYRVISSLTYMSIALGNISLKSIKKNLPINQYLPIQFESCYKIGLKKKILNFNYSLFYWLVWLKIKVKRLLF